MLSPTGLDIIFQPNPDTRRSDTLFKCSVPELSIIEFGGVGRRTTLTLCLNS